MLVVATTLEGIEAIPAAAVENHPDGRSGSLLLSSKGDHRTFSHLASALSMASTRQTKDAGLSKTEYNVSLTSVLKENVTHDILSRLSTNHTQPDNTH